VGRRESSGYSFRRAGLVVGVFVLALMGRSVAAEELFAFTDENSIDNAMTALNDDLAHNVVSPDPCRLYILNDLRGQELFDDATFLSMHQALAKGIFGEDGVDECTIESQAIEQKDVVGFLEERRKSGDTGLVLTLTYYKLSQGVTVFASLRGASGNLLGSSGRFDLPVVAVANTESPVQAQADAGDNKATNTEAESSSVSVDAALDQPATATKERVASVTRPAEIDAAQPEAALRRQLAVDAQIANVPSSPFNLRRVHAGVPSSIKTVRVVDAGGQDTALMAALADSFLSLQGSSSSGSIERVEFESDGRRGLKVAVTGGSTANVEAIDIEAADDQTAFELILDNQVDIVVTRQPISSDDAARFARTYGVNMRSRYAEHVVAIAEGASQSFDCGLRYLESDMLMSMEEDPSSERVYVYTNPSIPSPVRDQFIDYALTTDGQAVVAEHAVDLRLQLSDAGYAAWRYQTSSEQEAELPDLLERFRGLIRTSQRVSSTFRFDFASTSLVLDARSEQDLENLVDLIKSRDIDSRRILLFGFADSIGAAPYNAELSQGRADAVAIRLRLAGIPVPPRNVYGIGEDSPVACDLQLDGDRYEVGAQKNRRVEVWIES